MTPLLTSVLAAAMAIGVGPTPTSPAAAPASDSVENVEFSGDFRFAGGQRQRDAVAAAVEKAVQALLPIFHEIARKRLGRANEIVDSVSMSMEGDELVIQYGDREPMQAPLDGSVRDWRNQEGARVKIKMVRRGPNKVVQTTWNNGGRRVVVLTLDDGGRRLRMHSTMSSPRLPESITYRLTYRK